VHGKVHLVGILMRRILSSTRENLEFYIDMMLTFWATAAIVFDGNLTVHSTSGCLPKTSAVLVVLTESGCPNRAVESIMSRVYICSKVEELSNRMTSIANSKTATCTCYLDQVIPTL
jgi:hypothetical protein